MVTRFSVGVIYMAIPVRAIAAAVMAALRTAAVSAAAAVPDGTENYVADYDDYQKHDEVGQHEHRCQRAEQIDREADKSPQPSAPGHHTLEDEVYLY